MKLKEILNIDEIESKEDASVVINSKYFHFIYIVCFIL